VRLETKTEKREPNSVPMVYISTPKGATYSLFLLSEFLYFSHSNPDGHTKWKILLLGERDIVYAKHGKKTHLTAISVLLGQ
jgi:hypothetical protein